MDESGDIGERDVQWFGSSDGRPKLVKAPTSTAHSRFRESDHAHTVEASEGVVDYFVNPLAEEKLDQEFSELATEKFFRENVVLTGIEHHPAPESGYRVSSKSFGRALPVLYGEIPYARMLGGVVIQKGGGISGWKLNSRDGEKKDPIGFFGKKDADRDIKNSNALIKEGFRSSLILGYVELDPEWILSQIQDSVMKERVQHSLDILKAHNDVPVVMFRVDGTTERYKTTTGGLNSNPRRFRAELARGSRLLLDEAKRDGSLMNEYLENLGDDKDHVRSVLAKLENRETLTEPEARTYQQLYLAVTVRNARALGKLNSMSRDENVFFPFLMEEEGKDIDLAFHAMDHEASQRRVWAGTELMQYYQYMSAAGKNLFAAMKNAKALAQDVNIDDLWRPFTSQANQVFKALQKRGA